MSKGMWNGSVEVAAVHVKVSEVKELSKGSRDGSSQSGVVADLKGRESLQIPQKTWNGSSDVEIG